MTKIRPHQLEFIGASRTKQEFKDECDINHMLATYQRTGQMPPTNPRMAGFGDFSQVPDLHAAINQVKAAEMAFDQLPSGIRSRFDNDAGNLLDFLADPENAEEAIEIGLIDGPTETKETPPVAPAPGPTQPPAEPTDPPQEGSEEAPTT